jgi:methyl-galactoside transport system ATP-binding protein
VVSFPGAGEYSPQAPVFWGGIENATYVLQVNQLSKSFPGVNALDKVSINVRSGSVHALMGENGSGKSTLMKRLFGVYEPDDGEIILDEPTEASM